MGFRNPQALSSILASLGTLQPRGLHVSMFLNPIDFNVLQSNYYLVLAKSPQCCYDIIGLITALLRDSFKDMTQTSLQKYKHDHAYN